VILYKNNYVALKIIDVGIFLFYFIKISFPVHNWRQNLSACPRNYRGISLLPTTYKILSNILLSRLTYAEEIIGNHQCEYQYNRSTTEHIYCICQILVKKWEYNETVHQLLIDFRKAYDSVRREVSCNIIIEFVIPLKLVSLIKMCLKGIAESV
jgi:hypothetical protein